MLPRTLVDSAAIPGGGTLRLIRHGDDWSIMLGANALMTSRLSGSEEALAGLAFDRLAAPAPHVLIGGLGMGFTLRAALARLGPEGRVTVAELAPAVVGWARGAMAELFAGSLDDPRVDVRIADVADLIAAGPGAGAGTGAGAGGYDAILLDVDNGPDALSHPGNDCLYSAAGLAAARRALRPGGVLAVWSSAPDATFTRRLRQAKAVVEEVVVRAHQGRGGARHTIWVARWD